jgi:hypothetical protein
MTESTDVIDREWVDDFLGTIEHSIKTKTPLKWIDETGNEMQIILQQAVFDILKQNRHRLIKIGKRIFKEFLILMSRGEELEALVLVYDQLDTQSLVDKFDENAQKLEQIAIELEEERQFWRDVFKQVVVRLALGALGALL